MWQGTAGGGSPGPEGLDTARSMSACGALRGRACVADEGLPASPGLALGQPHTHAYAHATRVFVHVRFSSTGICLLS